MNTPADHANTVRHALESGQWGDVRDALAALDALQTQAETAAREGEDRPRLATTPSLSSH